MEKLEKAESRAKINKIILHEYYPLINKQHTLGIHSNIYIPWLKKVILFLTFPFSNVGV
jgi:hypothetical protein